MPLYEYQCEPNQHRFEVRHGYRENPALTCPECGAPVRRVIQPVGIVFKGSGFYATDSRSKNAANKPAASEDGDGKKETAAKDSTSKEGTAKDSKEKTVKDSTAEAKPSSKAEPKAAS